MLDPRGPACVVAAIALALAVSTARFRPQRADERAGPAAGAPARDAPLALERGRAGARAAKATDADGVPGAREAAPNGRFVRRARAAVARWLATAGVEARIGPAEREALVEALAALRASSRRALRDADPDPGEAAAHARLVVDTDRRFRETLGVGVARFLADTGPPDRVVDLAPAPQ